MKSEKDFMGEVRGFTGLAPEPVNLADSPAAASPAPGLAGEEGGGKDVMELVSILKKLCSKVLREVAPGVFYCDVMTASEMLAGKRAFVEIVEGIRIEDRELYKMLARLMDFAFPRRYAEPWEVTDVFATMEGVLIYATRDTFNERGTYTGSDCWLLSLDKLITEAKEKRIDTSEIIRKFERQIEKLKEVK